MKAPRNLGPFKPSRTSMRIDPGRRRVIHTTSHWSGGLGFALAACLAVAAAYLIAAWLDCAATDPTALCAAAMAMLMDQPTKRYTVLGPRTAQDTRQVWLVVRNAVDSPKPMAMWVEAECLSAAAAQAQADELNATRRH